METGATPQTLPDFRILRLLEFAPGWEREPRGLDGDGIFSPIEDIGNIGV